MHSIPFRLLIRYFIHFYFNIRAFGVPIPSHTPLIPLSSGTLGVPLRTFASLTPQKEAIARSAGTFASIL